MICIRSIVSTQDGIYTRFTIYIMSIIFKWYDADLYMVIGFIDLGKGERNHLATVPPIN